jgi:hypothetical protein
MNSTPIHPNDLLVEGAYVGDMMDFINDDEYNEMLTVKEKVKEYAKNYRYHEDPIFREKVLSRKRVKPENKKSMGRPLKYTIDENLNLTIIKKSI